MKATQLKAFRRAARLTQAQLARKLGRSQGYVSLLERGLRRPSMSLAARVVKVLELPPTSLPVRVGKRGSGRLSASRAAKGLAMLGYPGFAYLNGSRAPTNPTDVLLGTLGAEVVDVRLVEALPWLLLRFSDFDQKQTVTLAYDHGLQNRLGFVVALAKGVAESKSEYAHRLPELNELLSSLEPLRLAREDDLGQQSRSERFRQWIRENRSEAAVHWNLLTDLGTEHLAYVN